MCKLQYIYFDKKEGGMLLLSPYIMEKDTLHRYKVGTNVRDLATHRPTLKTR